jgi:hypothetical protein
MVRNYQFDNKCVNISKNGYVGSELSLIRK